jgi:hypothetical protein
MVNLEKVRIGSNPNLSQNLNKFLDQATTISKPTNFKIILMSLKARYKS